MNTVTQKVWGRGLILGLIASLALLLTPMLAEAATKMTGSATWTGQNVGKVKLRGALAVATSSTYEGSNGSVNFTGTLKGGKVSVTAMQLRDRTVVGKVNGVRMNVGTVSSAGVGSLFAYDINGSVKLTARAAKAMKKKGMKMARAGKSIGRLVVDGSAVHTVKNGEMELVYNSTLVGQFQYLASEATGSFEPFAGLTGAFPLSGLPAFQTAYATQLATDPNYLDNRISTPLVLNSNCVNEAAGTSVNSLPNAAGMDCAPATGTANVNAMMNVGEGGTLVGGSQLNGAVADGGIGLQLRLGSSTMPAGGPNYGAATIAAGNGIGGGVLGDPEIATSAATGTSTLITTTSLGRLPIAIIDGFTPSVVCGDTPNGAGNYECTGTGPANLTAIAANAFSNSFGASIPANTTLATVNIAFEIGN